MQTIRLVWAYVLTVEGLALGDDPGKVTAMAPPKVTAVPEKPVFVLRCWEQPRFRRKSMSQIQKEKN
jgi:hypothetical protein